MQLTYNISTRVGIIVQCTRNADHVTSYYVLVPGEETVRLNRSINIGSLKFRDAGVYTCEAREPVPGGSEPPVVNVSWTLAVERRPPACLVNESCNEAQGHSCWRDLCTCRSSDMSFFSKRGHRRCRLTGALSLTARVTALPRSAFDLLEISYYLVTYGDTVVTWYSDRVLGGRSVAKFMVDSPRRQFGGAIYLRQREFTHGGTVNVTAVLSGTPTSKLVQIDVPKSTYQIGDLCKEDADCSNAQGFCMKGRCSCTDSTGKDHGRPVDGQCVASCTQPKDCDSVQHSHCFGGVCQCFDGLHLYNRSCVPNRCGRHVYCSVNETCVSGRCFCRPGYMVENGRCVQAECFTDADCIWKNTECFSGRCVCLPGYRIIEGDCDREYFGSCSLGCTSVLNSQCGGGAMCVCSPGYVYRAIGGYETCSPIECHHGLMCRGEGAHCVDYACACVDGNESVTCREGGSAMLSFSEEEPPPHETVLLLCGGAVAFIAVGALPALVWRQLGPGSKLRRPPEVPTGGVGTVSPGVAAAGRATRPRYTRSSARSAGAHRKGAQETVPVRGARHVMMMMLKMAFSQFPGKISTPIEQFGLLLATIVQVPC
ncbi:uncharacterized protein LOC119463796 [Dermacentor silvarum]|uniref:uncharacterized protein LOC119463796 n=1 Tax=Dermacentor silvarum TaxID=543639 RepID=UPI00210179B5|nr:uncharacterized protein LOC119463796 [Dermacentor silvarum]